jgi:hypothetical protein
MLLGCDDPSAVGLDIIGEIGGDPVIVDLPATISHLDGVNQFTGQNSRFLIGQVDDPIFGTFRTHAYIDFGAMLGATAFRENTVTSAYLTLRRDYLYGDTLGTVSIDIFDMPAEWSAQGATADTSLAYGELVASYTVSAQDTLVTLQLPQTWVAANDTTLRSTVFATVFHGFHLKARSGSTVIGYAAGLSSLGATTASDTVTFPQILGRNLTVRERLTQPVESADVIPYQSTVGPQVSLSYDLAELVDQFAVNRGTLRVREDSLRIQQSAPADFVRTRPQNLNLYFRTPEGTMLLIERAPRQENGDFYFRSGDLYLLMDQIMRGQREPGTFELRTQQIPSATSAAGINTLDVMLIRREEGQRPDLRLVLTPLLD